MAGETFMSKLRTFLGIRPEPPRNDFRNPIWGDDDDDDGDELYSRHHRMDIPSQGDIHRELTKHMHDIFKSFGGMFGDLKTIFDEDNFDIMTGIHDPPIGGMLESNPEPEHFDSNSIRNYYLKPGYERQRHEPKDDDLDGKISSQEISGLLKKKDQDQIAPNITIVTPFGGFGGRTYSKTVITTSITKPDGTVETRRIVKSGNEVIDETTTTNTPDPRGPYSPGLPINYTGMFLSELASLFKNVN